MGHKKSWAAKEGRKCRKINAGKSVWTRLSESRKHPSSMATLPCCSPIILDSRFKYYRSSSKHVRSYYRQRFQLRAVGDKTKDVPPTSSSSSSSSSAEEITKKYGLEVGLWKIFSSKEEEEEDENEEQGSERGKGKGKGEQAKELLAKYGGAYLATSITLSVISFTLCYALISAGVDVSALLHKVGIASNETGEKVGTFALAYAAHKAASPIRFPPTVALTPIVASWIRNKLRKHN